LERSQAGEPGAGMVSVIPGRTNYYLRLRQRYRNLIGLVNWFWLRCAPRIIKKTHDPYDGGFWTNQEPIGWHEFAKVIVSHTNPKSVIDVGCGNGMLLNALKDHDSNLRLLGLDGSVNSILLARQQGLEVIEVDLVRSSGAEIQSIGKRLGGFDLALCLEVAEHFPAWHSRKLLKLLTTVSDLIVFSAAHPNQGGTLHVNEQPSEYWVAKFHRSGFRLAGMDQPLRNALSELDIPSYYKTNIHVFEKNCDNSIPV
jgi:SAM-dependent methyltransferase